MTLHLHFLGILGSGMSSLAIYCKESNYVVSGSDLKPIDDPILPFWIDKNQYTNTLNKSLIDQADLVIYSTAIKTDHPELTYAKLQGKTILHRSELISHISKEKNVISVTGTHGKTTTSSITSWIFEATDQNPSFLLGGIPACLPSAKYSHGKNLILEADESDGSFLKYKTHTGIITNIESDHLENHNNSFEQYLNNFKTFIQFCNICIYNIHDENTINVIKDINNVDFFSFGYTDNADFQILNIDASNDIQTITLRSPDKKVYIFDTQLQGQYNAENVVAAWVTAYLYNICPKLLSKKIMQFQGVKRRCEQIGTIPLKNQEIPILDDYGHHPSECRAVLKEYKRQQKKIIHIFEPHRFSRLNLFFDDFIDALKTSDVVLLQDVYSAGEEKLNRKDSVDLMTSLRNNNEYVFKVSNQQEIVSIVNQFLDENTVVLFQGAGNVTKIAHDCVKIWNHI